MSENAFYAAADVARSIRGLEDAIRRRDEALARVVDRICRRAGAEYDDPTVLQVRDWLREEGLCVVFGDCP